MSIEAALAEAATTFPVTVRSVEVSPTDVVLVGEGWNLLLMCPLRLRTPDVVLGWESPSFADTWWDLAGHDLERVEIAKGDPVFYFTGDYVVEVFADTDLDPWVLHVPGVVVVGAIPPLQT